MSILDNIFGKKKKGKWETFLKGVDYIEAHEAIRCVFDFAVKEGERKGGSFCMKQSDLDALKPFMDNPCYETALRMLQETGGLFENIFEDSKHRKLFSSQLPKTEKDMEKNWGKEYATTGKLCLQIIKAATACRDALIPLIRSESSPERLQNEIHVFHEFICFYMYWATWHAVVVVKLTEAQMRKFQSFIGPPIAKTAIESYYSHLADDEKGLLFSNFYERLNEAHHEYTKASQLESTLEGRELFQQQLGAMLLTLAKRAFKDAPKMETTTIGTILQIAGKNLGEMRLPELLAEIKREL